MTTDRQTDATKNIISCQCTLRLATDNHYYHTAILSDCYSRQQL